MRHRGTKSSKPAKFGGYRWYDRETGGIDLGLLAAEATRDDEARRFETPPSWLRDVPASIPDARAVDLARIEARARRAFVLFSTSGPGDST